MALFSLIRTDQLVREAAGESLADSASSQVILIQATLGNLIRETGSISTNPAIESMGSDRSTSILTREVEAFSPTIRQAILANTRGRVIAVAARPPGVRRQITRSDYSGTMVQREDWFQNALASASDESAEPSLGTVENRPIIGEVENSGSAPPAPVVSVAVYSGPADNRKTVGVLAIFPNWPALAVDFTEAVADQTSRAGRRGVIGLLVDQRGRTLAGPEGSVDLTTDFSDDVVIRRAFETDKSGWVKYYDDPNDGGSLEGQTIGGWDRFEKRFQEAGLDWAFIVDQEEADALRETRGLKWRLILITLIVAIGAGVVAVLVGRGLARQAGRLRSSANEVEAGAVSIKGSAEEGRDRAQRTAELASNQVLGLEEMTGRVEEMRATGVRIGESAKLVAEQAGKAAAAGEDGRAAAEEVDRAMAGIDGRVRALASEIGVLSKQTDQIGEIIATVSSIADQSNLLAFNATIEAAKAGEHGAGFSVVAEEVRTLAEQSKRATAQIRSILSEIDRATREAERSAMEGIEAVETGRVRAESAARTIDQLAAANLEAEKTTSEIAALAPAQQEESARVISAAEESLQRATEVREEAGEAAKSSAELDRLAERLRELSSTLSGG
ncbi:MAG: methyl-accepting chemotaxis protein [Solirubrobacterales bacterium]